MISTRPLKDGLGKELGFYVELGGLKVFVLGFFMWHIRLEVVKDRMLPRISGSGECSLGSLSAPHTHSLSLSLGAEDDWEEKNFGKVGSWLRNVACVRRFNC